MEIVLLPLPYNGEVTKLTRPWVIEKKIGIVFCTDCLSYDILSLIFTPQNYRCCRITSFFGGRGTWPELVAWTETAGDKMFRKRPERVPD